MLAATCKGVEKSAAITGNRGWGTLHGGNSERNGEYLADRILYAELDSRSHLSRSYNHGLGSCYLITNTLFGVSPVGKGKSLWIMKPVGMSRGRGIRIIDDIKNICYADKVT